MIQRLLAIGRRALDRFPWLVAGGVFVWALLLLLGIKWVSDFERVPGALEAAPPTWPHESALSPQVGSSTLLMFVHPKCPCSRASLSELDAIMNSDPERTKAFVVFLRPKGAAADWERTDTWETAGTIPHTTRVVDRDGVEAGRFGAVTSGQVVLYDPLGHLEFSGGITESRGHVGKNVGRQTVLDLLTRAPTDRHEHAVFGCPLVETIDNVRFAGSAPP
jgi:hypothetical protein